MRISLKHTTGAILIDVLSSIFIFTMGLAGTLTIINAAIQTNDRHRHELVAGHLAEEGLEVVRNMRDTNWLLHPSTLRECWNFWEDTNGDGVINAEDEVCQESDTWTGQNQHPIGADGETEYIVDFNPDSFRWILISLADPEDARLYREQVGGASLYTHRDCADDPDCSTPTNEGTPYRRTLELYYLNNEDCDQNDLSTCTFPGGRADQDNVLLLVSRVQWYESGGREREIVLTTLLTDYFDRYEWDS